MNEGVYRSPKWLRKFLDYEIHTGEDIKGKVSKREIRQKAAAEEKARIEREKAEADRIKREWNNRWDNMSKEDFKDFYKEEFPSEVKYQYDNYIYSSDLEKIRSKWQNNPEIWTRFDKWIKKKREAEAKQEEIKRDLENLYNSIIRDFYSSPYRDKIRTETHKGTIKVYYTFEDGRSFEMWENELTYGNTVYTLGLIHRNKFITLINKIIGDMKNRPGGSKSHNTNSNKGSHNTGSNRGTKANKYSNHPKGALYQTLKDTIEQRELQLKKMSKNDPERVSLQNELDTAKRKLDALKDKYKFENFKHLSSFNLYNESYQDKEISLGSPSVGFGITYGELDEVLYEITDEFPELDYQVDNSLQSSILDTNPSYETDKNSFVVTFYNKQSEFPVDLRVLHYVEPKIFNLVGHVNDKLGMYGLEVYFNDFGENDAYYELLITKKGNKPKLNRQRYIIDDNGEIQYKQ